METQAGRVHDERLSECRAALRQTSHRDKFLLSEVAACRTETETMELVVQQRYQSEVTKTQNYSGRRRCERNKFEALNFLGFHLKLVFSMKQKNQCKPTFPKRSPQNLQPRRFRQASMVSPKIKVPNNRTTTMETGCRLLSRTTTHPKLMPLSRP